MRTKHEQAFTLVEIMIVVAIIGLLAALAVPTMIKARQGAENGRYAADLRVATGAFEEFAIYNGGYPADMMPGQVPNGMDDYLTKMRWTSQNSLGGLWDWDFQTFGVKAGVSVYQPRASRNQMLRLDKIIDDGDLSSGQFRERSSGYISVIE